MALVRVPFYCHKSLTDIVIVLIYTTRALERLLALHCGDVKGGGPVGENEKMRGKTWGTVQSALVHLCCKVELKH